MILGILQARISSTRLPGKVLKPILGKPMLFRQIERIHRSKNIDKILVATSIEKSDDIIEDFCHSNNIEYFRGNLNDVLDRYYQAAKLYHTKHVVRLTGDCPLIDPEIIDNVITYHIKQNNDYTSNTLKPTFPDGLDVEIMRFNALEQAWTQSKLPSHREHVTRFLYTQPELFKLGNVQNVTDLSHLRWTVDDQTDFDLINEIYQSLYEKNPTFNFEDILTFLETHPKLKTLNTNNLRNAGLQKSLSADQEFLRKYKHEHPA